MKFYIVDAFTQTVFGGNPAGVVILPEGAAFPEDEIMRKTAAELRYSETAFIRRLSETEFNIRYFTPAAEVELCGHATIGSFVALLSCGMVKAGETYKNKTLAGDIQVEVTEGSILMDMAAPQYIGAIREAEAREELYRVMGLSAQGQGVVCADAAAGELSGANQVLAMGELIPELISTGLPDIMMPVKDEAELSRIAPDFAALAKLSERYEVTGVHAFTIHAEDGAVHCRNFAPLYDIDEEAATGTSNGALTYYLYRQGLLASEGENVFIQGEAMDRPSKITSKLSVEGEAVTIRVGGSGVILAEGEIHI